MVVVVLDYRLGRTPEFFGDSLKTVVVPIHWRIYIHVLGPGNIDAIEGFFSRGGRIRRRAALFHVDIPDFAPGLSRNFKAGLVFFFGSDDFLLVFFVLLVPVRQGLVALKYKVSILPLIVSASF